MDEYDEENIEYEPIKPKIYVLEISSLGEVFAKGWEKGSQDKKRSNCSHEPVAEICDVDKKCDIG